MVAPSKWHGQKPAASAAVKKALADGTEKTLDELIEALKPTGLSTKNAHKAIYAETAAGTVVMTGTWKDGKFKAKGAG